MALKVVARLRIATMFKQGSVEAFIDIKQIPFKSLEELLEF